MQHSFISLLINKFIFPPLNERNGHSSLAHELVFLALSLRSTVYSFLPSSVYAGCQLYSMPLGPLALRLLLASASGKRANVLSLYRASLPSFQDASSGQGWFTPWLTFLLQVCE